MSVSLTKTLGGAWAPFLRGGWAQDGGRLYEAAISTGFGYTGQPGRFLLGMGVNWSRPNRDTYGATLDDQVTAEIFCQLQLRTGT